MANRVYHIGTQSSTSLGVTQVLNTNGISNSRMRVRELHIRFDLDVTGVAGGAIGEADVGTTRIELLWQKTNRPWLNNLEARGLDLYCAREHDPSGGSLSYSVLTDQTTSAATANEQITFDFAIPVSKIQAKNGEDFAQMLDEIGQLTIQLPTQFTGGAAVNTLNTWTTTFYALGEDYASAYWAGSQCRVDSLASSSGATYEALCYGNKLRQIFSYSTDTTNDPQTEEQSPRVLLDGREVYNYRNLSGGDLAYYSSNGFAANRQYSEYYQLAASGNSTAQSLLCAAYCEIDPRKSIVDMSTVNVAQLTWSSRMTDPASNCTFVVETVYPSNSGAALAQRVPGSAYMTAGDVADVVSRPGPTGSAASAPIQDKAFLPAKISV